MGLAHGRGEALVSDELGQRTRRTRANGRAGALTAAEMRAVARNRLIESRLTPNAISLTGLIGNLETMAITMEAEAMTKKFEADIYIFHSHLTERCKALGIDVPSVMSGGGGR